jgi:hypothetical protein
VNDQLAPRIEAVVQRAGIPAPALLAIGRKGARLVNAFAFPSTRRPAIVFGSALIELLDPDETAAIYAHELSHIEQYTPRRLRRLQALNRLLIVLGVALPIVVQRVAPVASSWLMLLWPVIVLGSLVARTRKRKNEETESDLRAAALVGDPEVVARALIKVHLHALIPRRWAIDFERRATHPSLARRIQALRGDAVPATASPSDPVIVPSAREGTVIVFDDARAYWFDGVPAGTASSLASLRESATSMRSVVWAELVELRVVAQGAQRALRAVHRNGDAWQVPLDSAHVADVQRALDRIDVRLHRELGTPDRKAPQVAAAAIVVAMFLAMDIWLLFVPAALALFRPSTAALGAVGVMAVARGAWLLAFGRDWLGLGFGKIGAATLAAVGVIAVVIAIRRVRRENRRDGTRLATALIGSLCVLLATLTVTAGTKLSLAELADLPFLPALAVSLLGLSAAFITVGSGAARVAAAGATALALAAAASQSTVAMRLRATTKLDRISATATELGRVDLPTGFTGLHVSPNGTRFLVQHYNDRQSERASPSMRHIVGSFDGQRRELNVVQVDFLDDQHILTLREAGDGYELRLERADVDSAVWTSPFPTLENATLSVLSRKGEWTLVGYESTADSIVVVSGTAASPAGTVHRFAEHDSLAVTEELVFDGGSTLLLPVYRARGGTPMSLALFGVYPMRADLWRADSAGMRMVGTMDAFPTCGPPDGGRTVCFTHRRGGGMMWMLGSDGSMTPLGELRGADAARVAVGPGLEITFPHGANHVSVVDASARRMTEVRLPAGSGYVFEARASAGHVVVLRQDTTASRITRYRLN